LFLVGLIAFGLVARRAGATPVTLILFLCSAGVVGCLHNGNIEWLPLLGLLCPPSLGLILLAIKPQVGLGLGLFWAVTVWRKQGLKRLLATVTPVTALLVLSFLLYGLWPLRFRQTLAWSVDNTALGLQAAFVGAVLLVRALRTGDEGMALAAGPFLAPYVLQFTWSTCLVGLLRYPWEMLAAVICLWIPVILRVLS
jgi:hypothetical protein